MQLEERKLGDFFRIKHGYAFKGEFFTDAGKYIVLTPGNFYDAGGFKKKGDKEKFYSGDFPKEFILKKGDLIIAMTEQAEGLLGSSAIVPENNRYLHNQRLGLVIELDERKLDRIFLYHLFNTSQVRQQIRATATGAKIRHTAPERILKVGFKCPTIKAQRSIASILSAYDKLIENNTRRIAILEEMAMRIYEEWFVHFRFPGHEKSALIDSVRGKIPDGWTISTIAEVCISVTDGDWIETKDQGGDDYRLLQISNIGVGAFIETGNYRFITQATFERLRCQEIKPMDILVARMPKPTGRAWLATTMHWRMITAVDVAILKADPKIVSPIYLVSALNSPDHLATVEKYTTGTTRPRISRSALMGLPILVPSKATQNQYEKHVAPIYDSIRLYRKKNQNLAQTRDLLLPKLISGEIDVSHFSVPEQANV